MVFFFNYAIQKQVDNVIDVGEAVEQVTRAFQIQETDVRARNAYKQYLMGWARFSHADIVVVNQSGQLAETTCSIRSVPQEYLDEVLSGDILNQTGNFGGQYNEKVLTIGMPVRYQGTIIGAVFFNCKMPKLRKTAVDLIIIFMFAALLSMVVAFIVIYIQARRISKPIGEINAAARDIAAGNMSKRVAVNSTDEIGQLASSFNFMADALEDLEKQRSGFISDVSHELRTPMTSISGFVQGIIDGTIPEEKRDYYLNIVLEESVRLTKLVNDMLEMSKMSSSEYKLDITKFELNELVRVCVIGMGNKIDDKNLEMNIDFTPDKLEVLGDKDSIKRVLINLIDNAIKFSYPNTTIGINTWVEGKKAYFCVGNFGDGIESSDLSNVFNRFYKTDASRHKEKSGAGLGLSLVKNILVLHKQSIWVESINAKEGSNAKYTKFTFTLELA